MLDHLKRQPWTVHRHAYAFAELHAAMHNCAVPADLPSMKMGFENNIRTAPNLPQDHRDAVLRQLDAMPDDNQLCHGDFHPGNVMLTVRGPIIIDWMTAKRGSPMADVARTLLLLTIGTPPSMLERIIVKFVRGAFVKRYLEHYFKLQPGDRDQLEAWKPIIAAARMNEKIEGEHEALIKMKRHEVDQSPNLCYNPFTTTTGKSTRPTGAQRVATNALKRRPPTSWNDSPEPKMISTKWNGSLPLSSVKTV